MLLNQSALGPLAPKTQFVLKELLLTGYFIFLDQFPAKPEGVRENSSSFCLKAICPETLTHRHDIPKIIPEAYYTIPVKTLSQPDA